MNIFVESSSIEEIRRAVESGLADGVAVPETDYSGSATHDGVELIDAIVQEFAIPVCVQVEAVDSDDIYRHARNLSRISDHIIVQLPLVDDAIEPMHRLSQEGVDICANFVFTGAQAVLAAKAGASSVRVSLQDIDAHGRTSVDVISEIRALLEASRCECDVMVSSPASSTQFSECITAGAQIVAIRPEVLHSLLLHPITDRSIDRFLNSLNNRSRVIHG